MPLLRRLGIRTLGHFEALGEAAIADRFGEVGLAALRAIRGEEDPSPPPAPREVVIERLSLATTEDLYALENALSLLIRRLLARRERRGRAICALWLAARLVGGAGWRVRAMLRSATADPDRIKAALAPKLGLLPAPAEALSLEVEQFGPAGAGQVALFESMRALRRTRLEEAVRQAQLAAGEDALLRVVEVDPRSRVPERRIVLAPLRLARS